MCRHAPFGELISADNHLFVYVTRSEGHILMQTATTFARISLELRKARHQSPFRIELRNVTQTPHP